MHELSLKSPSGAVSGRVLEQPLGQPLRCSRWPARPPTPQRRPRPSSSSTDRAPCGGPIGTEKAAKIDLVRPAFRAAFANAPQSLKLGLMSFGQRRKGDCSDVQVIAPLEDGPLERIAAPVDKLDPRGKGPIALALREAAKQIPAGEAGTILIVHDGPDNCGVDICTIAADIAKANPKIVVHLVSLGLEKADLARLQCVAKSTNGTVTDVRDGLSIPSALKSAVEIANLATATPQSSAEAAAPEKPGLSLTAVSRPRRPRRS